jgi:hypothetical protein
MPPHKKTAKSHKSHKPLKTHNKGRGRGRSQDQIIVQKTSNRLTNLLNTISNNRRNLDKSEINLPARLMQNHNQPLTNDDSSPIHYSKSVSSTMTSSMHDGQVHTAGKEVINDSTQPYIAITEMHNGQVERYMIPRDRSGSNQPNPNQPNPNQSNLFMQYRPSHKKNKKSMKSRKIKTSKKLKTQKKSKKSSKTSKSKKH